MSKFGNYLPSVMESEMGNESSQSLTERELGTLKEFVENTLRKSGMLLMEIFGKGDRKLRFDDRLVTEADNAAWELISSKIKGSFRGSRLPPGT